MILDLQLCEELQVLTKDNLNAFLEAGALSERKPVLTVACGQRSTTAESWAGQAITPGHALTSYVTSKSLDVRGLEALLNGSPWAPRGGSASWIKRVEPWLLDSSGVETCLAIIRSTEPLIVENTRLESTPFPGLIEPIIYTQQKFVSQWTWLSEEAHASILNRLRERIATLATRSLISELRNGASRYADLNEELSERVNRVNFFCKYPVLARDIINIIECWRNQIDRMLSRLHGDSAELLDCGLLSVPSTTLSRVRFTGDDHGGGECVAILEFKNGNYLVYKPRDCRAFTFYREMLEIISEDVPKSTRLYAPRCMPRQSYGWVEFIEHCKTSINLQFYLRQIGGMLAIAQTLGASDLHLENVIASKRGPIPVDLETLIQNRGYSDKGETSADIAVKWLNSSVLGVGILPVQLKTGEDGNVDVSVLTGGLHTEAAQTVFVHQIVDAFADNMRMESVPVEIGYSKNQPPNMTANLVHDYRGEVSEGFRNTCHAIMKSRTQLVELLLTAPNMKLRHIARSTRSYSLLMTELRQPSRLRSGLHRDDLLRNLWARLDKYPTEARLVQEEERAIRNLDIPMFNTSLDDHNLLNPDGQYVIDYFAKTTREDVISRVEGLSSQSIEESTQLINESIIAATPSSVAQCEGRESLLNAANDDAGALRRLLSGQVDMLVNSAIYGEDDVTWISVASSVNSTGLEYRALGPTLYDGLAGVMFASTYAHRLHPADGLYDIARRASVAVSDILSDWAQGKVELPLGAFSGASGLLYALAHFSAEFGETGYEKLCSAVLWRLEASVQSDKYYDVMAGAAGAIAVLTSSVMKSLGWGRVEPALQALSEHLLGNAVPAGKDAIAWETGDSCVRLGGFSHGATGIGWALSKAASFLKDDSVAKYAKKALHFDDALFDEGRQRWRDMRPESAAQGEFYPNHWCHGSAGILMARISSWWLLDDDVCSAKVIGAIREALAIPAPADDSLCHGTFGVLNSLECEMVHSLVSAEFYSFAEHVTACIAKNGVKYGLPEGITSVRGLMLGTAGAVYSLSRQIDRSIPNVLLLE